MAKKISWHANLRYIWQPTIFNSSNLRARWQYRVSRDTLMYQYIFILKNILERKRNFIKNSIRSKNCPHSIHRSNYSKIQFASKTIKTSLYKKPIKALSRAQNHVQKIKFCKNIFPDIH
jgi:hypothetical protein